MALARDENFDLKMMRDGDPIGGVLVEASAVTSWKRLMPADNSASLVDGQEDRRLDIGTLRADILSIVGWNLLFLGDGYFEQHVISKFENNIVTTQYPIKNAAALRELGAGISWVIYPTLDIPLGITPSVDIEVGVGGENVYTPSPIKDFGTIEGGQLCIFHTNQIQKIFFKSAAAVNITWGEHFII